MTTTGRLGSIYSQLGGLQLGADPAGRVIVVQAALYAVPAHDLTVQGAIGERKTRTISSVAIAVSRPPSRTIPLRLAAIITATRTIPATLAAMQVVSRTIPVALATRITGQRVVPLAIAVERDPVPALVAPRRQSLIPHLLEVFTSLYDRDPHPVPMLTIVPIPGRPGMPWRISGSLFEIAALPDVTPSTPTTVTRPDDPGRVDALYRDLPLQTATSPQQGTQTPATGLAPVTRDLRRYTIGALANELTALGYTATAVGDYGPLGATTLIDGSGDIMVSPSISGFTTILWRILRGLALGGELLLDDLDHGLDQLDLRLASGRWLDWWGALYGVPREVLEGDSAYRTRISWSVLRPRSNNIGLAAILRAVTGLDLHVTDGVPVGIASGNPLTPSVIDRTWSADQATPGTYFPGYPPRLLVALPPGTPPSDTARVLRLVRALRAAGVQYSATEYVIATHDVALRASLDS